ncbi:MAG: MBL fold metallo-hydrolase [Gammaproteobacteria bacterium]
MKQYYRRVAVVAIIIAAVLGSVGLLAQGVDKFKDIRIQTQKVRDGIYMLTGRGGNIGVLVGKDGVVMIDDQFAPLTGRIKAAIAKLSDQPIRFLINTHWHGDHTGGNENLGKEGVVIVAHDNVYQRMSREGFLALFQKSVPPAPEKARPVISFNDQVTFHLNGMEIHAAHYEHAHTDGDSVIYFKDANVIHTGDIFFNGRYPFIDTSSGGSVRGVIQAVRQIMSFTNNQTKLIPGHGLLAGKKDLQAYLDMLLTVSHRMQKLITEGKTLDEIKALKPNADYDAALGNNLISPDKFLEILYEDLKMNNKQDRY